jgi:hypothetical protein
VKPRFALGCLAIAIGLAGCATDGGRKLTGDTLELPDLHVAISKLPDWRYLTPKEKYAARFAVTYQNTRWDRNVKADPWPARITIAKYPEPRVEFNPVVSVDLYPFGYEFVDDPVRAAGVVLRYYQSNLFTAVTIVERLGPTTLAGRKAGYFHIRYELETTHGPRHEIDERVWAVNRGTSAYLIFARGAQQGPDEAKAELDAMVRSLRFTD